MNKLNTTVLILVTCVLFQNHAFGQNQSPPVVVRNPMDVNPHEYIDKVKLPPGFKISIYADDVKGARSMALGTKGTLFVGSRRPTRNTSVYAVVDTDNDLKADKVVTIATGLYMANGIAFRNGSLYVAEPNRITRYDNIEDNLDNIPEPVVINDSFPSDRHHGWKFIRFGPDGKLYVPVGAPCNICEPSDQHGLIARIDANGTNKEVYARGIRNTVGFDWHPGTGELWFTDNGRDLWGDDKPPEELNHAPVTGLHFGYPYRYGKDLVDTEFKTDMTADQFTPAKLEMPAHSAALGMRFYTGKMFPEKYKNQILIPHHGSWNRSKPQGYYISLVTLNGNKAINFEKFATGWLIDDKFWGRPVDIEIMPDGSILVSDDHAGVIYRITYNK